MRCCRGRDRPRSPRPRPRDGGVGRGVLVTAAARMVEDFLDVQVWDAAPMLRRAADRLAVASSAMSLLVLSSDGVRSSSTGTSDGVRSSSTGTGGEVSASDGSSFSVPLEVAALLDGERWDELDLIRPAGVSVLHEIALRALSAGCTKELFRAFPNAPCDVLDRFLSILRVEGSQRTTEAMIKRWGTVTKIIGKAVVAMRRQLYAQAPGAFDSFRDEYLLAIAENRVSTLLEFADGFTSITSHEKLIYILRIYEALSDAAPGLLLLFTGAPRKETISKKAQDILTRLADVANLMLGGLLAKMQGGCSHAAAGAGIHPLARDTMTCVELLARHHTTLNLILADDGYGRVPPASSLAGLVAKLIAGLERNLQESYSDVGSSRHLFLANNTGFILSRAVDDAEGVASLLGPAWAARCRSRLERHVASYVDSCWGTVVAVLETPAVCGGRGNPAKVLAEFNAAFDQACAAQVPREVPDPALRAALRNAVGETVVPAYRTFMEKHPRLGKSIRYSADDLAESLSELFEGEAGGNYMVVDH